ncbi:MAG: hypothetical protein JWO38_545 [Gemmataceae bacterium]|nr:hypothetical protein [Gemmataceae bacterium]
MRTRTFALLGLVAGIGTAAQARPDPAIEYKLFASSDGRYKVLFPGPVKTETTDVKAAAGTLKLTLDTVQPADGVIFMVTYVDASDAVAKAPPGPRLDKVRDGNKGADGKVQTDKEIEVGAEKYPGRDLLIEKPTTFVRNRVVIAGNRLYQVLIQGPKEFVTSKDADRFFDSFEVTR